MRPRKPWIAALLSIACPGLGHIYLGQAARGVSLYAVMLLAGPLLAFLALRLPAFPLGLILALVGGLGVVGFVIWDAVRAAKPQGAPFQPQGYNRWYVYLLLFLASLVVQEVVARPLIRVFAQAFRIPAGSMLPTLQIGDHMLVDKFRYHLAPIQRKDIVVFPFPPDETRLFIKRVIGLPGETVEVRGKQVLVNGVALRELYAVYEDIPVGMEREHWGPQVVPPGWLFVLGDNRDHSMDSRVWGFIDVHKVQGKVVGIYFSWNAEARRVRWARIGATIH